MRRSSMILGFSGMESPVEQDYGVPPDRQPGHKRWERRREQAAASRKPPSVSDPFRHQAFLACRGDAGVR
jgi:hypothetical protein